jgi:hypothetical protein
MLAAAAVAVAAATGAYTGKTSQKQTVTLALTPTTVSKLQILVLDKCSAHHTLKSLEKFPPVPIRNGKFGGKFVPTGGHLGESATLRGTVGHTRVTGSIQDISYSKQVHRLCRGSATFGAKHR